jgi:hypothetical protein
VIWYYLYERRSKSSFNDISSTAYSIHEHQLKELFERPCILPKSFTVTYYARHVRLTWSHSRQFFCARSASQRARDLTRVTGTLFYEWRSARVFGASSLYLYHRSRPADW